LALFLLALTPQAIAAMGALAAATGIAVWGQTPAGQQATQQAAQGLANAVSRARTAVRDAVTDDTCEDCPCHRTVVISKSAYPESAQHVLDAQRAGYPSTLTIDRTGATARRKANIRDYPRVAGKQPDEYPPAMFAEGGPGSSIRNIDASDNMASGASMGNQLRGAREGCKATIVVGP
jgi:hypothetical protein